MSPRGVVVVLGAVVTGCSPPRARPVHRPVHDAAVHTALRPDVAPVSAPATPTSTPAWTAAFRLRNRAFPTITEPDAVVHAPEGFDPNRPFHLVVLLHGWGGNAMQWVVAGNATLGPAWSVRNGVGMEARHDLAASNSLLVALQFGIPRSGNWSGRYLQPGFFARVLSELLEEALVARLGGPHSLADVQGITLVGSSAGGVAAANLMLQADVRARVRNVVLFDAFYAGESTFARWLLEAPTDAPRRFVCIHGGTHYTMPQALELTRRITPALGPRVVTQPLGAMEDEVRTHAAVFAGVDCEHVCMSGAWFDKVLRGLELPPRALNPASDPRVPWRPANPAVEPVAVTVGAEVRGALDSTDARFRDWAPYDDYAVDLPAERAVTVTVTGGRVRSGYLCHSLDVEAEILDGTTRVALADDGAGMLNTRLTLRPPRAGRYTLRVAAHGPWENFGPYTLRISEAP